MVARIKLSPPKTLRIVITRTGIGRRGYLYSGRILDGETEVATIESSKIPLCDGARAAQALNTYSPNTRLEMWREGDPDPAMTARLSVAAGLRVADNDWKGVRFETYSVWTNGEDE